MRRGFSILLVILALVGIGIGGYKAVTEFFMKYTEVAEEIQGDLVVTAEEIDAALTSERFSKISRELLDNSLPNKAKERTEKTGISDAVSFPFKVNNAIDKKVAEFAKAGDSKAWARIRSEILREKLTEADLEKFSDQLDEELLRSLVYLDMVIRGLDRVKIGGKSVTEMNSFMLEGRKLFKDGYKTENGFLWAIEKDAQGRFCVTEQYRRIAIGTRLLLDRFVLDKKLRGYKSVVNYRLNLETKSVLVRTVKAEYQENLPSFVLTYRTKKMKDLVVLGFNLHDRRLEILKKDKEPAVKKQDPEPGKPRPNKPSKPEPRPNKPSKPDKPDKPDPDPDDTIIDDDSVIDDGDDGIVNKRKKKEKGKDPSFDPVNKRDLPHIGTGSNQPDDGNGGYRPQDTKPLPDSRDLLISDQNGNITDSNGKPFIGNVIQKPEEKSIPTYSNGGHEYFVNPSTGKSEEIIHNDNVEKPEEKPIPVQPKQAEIEKSGPANGRVELNDIP